MNTIYYIFSTIWQYLTNFSFHLIFSELLIFKHFKRRDHFYARFIPLTLAFTLITAFAKDQFYFLPFFQIGWYNISWIIAFILSVFILWFSFDVDFKTTAFYGIIAYNVQHFVAGISTLICEIAIEDFSSADFFDRLTRTPITILMYAAVYYICLRNMPRYENYKLHNGSLFLFSIFSLLIVNVLSVLQMHAENWTYLTSMYNCVSSAFLLVIQTGMFEIKRLAQEKEITAQILAEVQKQTEHSKAEIDLINQKCHDLKHQLIGMQKMNDPELRRRNADEISDVITKYDSYAKTGNLYLDAILTEKGLLCAEKGIHLTYIIPAEHLNFIESVDIFSLFGNALDNAIEAVEQEAQEHRIITIHSTMRGNLLNIRIENYCSRKLTFENGIPVSTKEDDGYHGFGTKSIGLIVEKYHGEYTMSQSEDRFVLSMLFNIK